MTDLNLTLNNGVEMPAFGLGVFQSDPADTVRAVKHALGHGYRLVDTAAVYGNEKEVAQGLAESGLARDEVFVTTKLWITDYGYDKALYGFDRSMRKLGLEQLDLWLLHQPFPSAWDETVAAWKAAISVLQEGRVRAIGVSNMSLAHIDALIEATGVAPAVNQVEVHPFFAQPELLAGHQSRGIVTQAWSPIGGVQRYMPWAQAKADPMSHPVVHKIAEVHAKTPAQVILRWHLERGTAVIPKSVNEGRIRENADIFDFTLTPSEVAEITALDTGRRGGPDPETFDLTTFPVVIED